MSDLRLRVPTVSESHRVLHLFRNVLLPANAQVLVATRSHPVERFVGALAGWKEGEFVRFYLACLPGADREQIAYLLISEAAGTTRAAGILKLMYAELLAQEDPWIPVLRKNQFEILRSERFFRIPSMEAAKRVLQMLEKYQADIPANWRTESIRALAPECVFDLIAPHRLMTTEGIRRFWQATAAHGFDSDMSSVVFEADKPFGTLLARRMGDVLCYDIRVVDHTNARLRALANLVLFRHNFKTYNPASPIRWLQFRGGETEHRETANLAFRMGGEEMPMRHVFARNL